MANQLANFNPVGSFQGARQNALALERQENLGQRESTQFDQNQALQRATIINQSARALGGLPQEQRASAFQKLAPRLQQFGIDPAQFSQSQFTDEDLVSVITSTQGFIQSGGDPASLREFQSLTQNLSPEDVEKARRIKLRLDPGAPSAAAKTVDVGGVPHIFDPIKQTLVPATVQGSPVTAKTVSESEAAIKGRSKQAEEQAKLSTSIVKKGFEGLTKIQKNVINIDRAIDALDRGAKSGAIQRFAPRISAASRELRQLQNELGLDIIGAVTFGALSQGELDLALDTALDLGQNEDALKDILIRKKAAQDKLMNYMRGQISFLSGVNEDGTPRTVAQFLESRGQATQQSQELTEGVIIRNQQTGQRMQVVNGQLVEI